MSFIPRLRVVVQECVSEAAQRKSAGGLAALRLENSPTLMNLGVTHGRADCQQVLIIPPQRRKNKEDVKIRHKTWRKETSGPPSKLQTCCFSVCRQKSDSLCNAHFHSANQVWLQSFTKTKARWIKVEKVEFRSRWVPHAVTEQTWWCHRGHIRACWPK